MKKNVVVLCIIFMISGCAEKKYFREVISNQMVSISKERILNHEFIVINIPLEFEINLNRKNIIDVGLFFEIDDKRQIFPEEYLMYNTVSEKKIFSVNNKHYENYPTSIYLNYFYRTSSKDIEKLLEMYNVNRGLDSLKANKDIINLVSYAKFRKDNPKFLKEMRKNTDSLQLSIGFKGGEQMVVGEKIKW
jgi:hypothetical protein